MLDEPQRYHLDDSSNENDNSVSRSGSSKSFSSAGQNNPQFVSDDNDQGPDESTADANFCTPEESNNHGNRDNIKDGKDVRITINKITVRQQSKLKTTKITKRKLWKTKSKNHLR